MIREDYKRISRGLIALFVILLLIRIYQPSIDPPQNISYNEGLYLREGISLHNASNLAVFGKFNSLEKSLQVENNVILSYMQYLNFRVFGVSLVSARVLYSVLSVCGIFLFFLGIKEEYGEKTAFLCVSLLGFNYVYIVYNRMAIEETPMLFFILASFFFWQKGLNNRFYRVLAPIFVFIAIHIKAMAMIMLPALISAAFCCGIWGFENKKKTWMVLIDLLAGIFISFIVFSILNVLIGKPECFLLLFRDAISTFFSSIPHTKETIFRLFWQPFFTNSLCISLAILTIVPCMLLKFFRDPQNFSSGEILLIAWIVFGFIGMNLSPAVPTRYFVNIIPPITALISIKLVNFRFTKRQEIEKVKTVEIPFLEYFFIVFFMFPIPYFFLDTSIKIYTIIFMIFAIILYPVVNDDSIAFFIKKIIHSHRKKIFTGVISIFLGFSGVKVLNWFSSYSLTEVESIEAFSEKIKDKVILGHSAFLLSLGSKNRPMILKKARKEVTGTIDYATLMFGHDKDNNLSVLDSSLEDTSVNQEGIDKLRAYAKFEIGKYIVKLYDLKKNKDFFREETDGNYME